MLHTNCFIYIFSVVLSFIVFLFYFLEFNESESEVGKTNSSTADRLFTNLLPERVNVGRIWQQQKCAHTVRQKSIQKKCILQGQRWEKEIL